MATEAYFRIKRDGEWQSVEIDDMTDEELDYISTVRPEMGWKWAKFLAAWIRDNVEEGE